LESQILILVGQGYFWNVKKVRWQRCGKIRGDFGTKWGGFGGIYVKV